MANAIQDHPSQFACTRPTVIGFVGPNGSGKSSIVEKLGIEGVSPGDTRFKGRIVTNPNTGGILIPVINPDEIARNALVSRPGLTVDECNAWAFEEAQKIREIYSSARIDFALETVGSHPSKAEFFEKLSAQGYYVCILFVGTEEPEINVRRVKQRVALGGHDVPYDKVISRYERSMRLLPRYYLAADYFAVYDNSRDVAADSGNGPRLLLVKRDGQTDLTADGDHCAWLHNRLYGLI